MWDIQVFAQTALAAVVRALMAEVATLAREAEVQVFLARGHLEPEVALPGLAV